MAANELWCGPIPGSFRERMAEVIDNAFAENLKPILPDRQRRLRVLQLGTELRSVVGAYVGDDLAGVVGLKTSAVGVFDAMTFAMLRTELGFGALKAKVALTLLDRPLEPGTMRIEFLAVDDSARGIGVGSALLAAVEERACDEKAHLLELHVAETNADARRLYERAGFRFAPSRQEPAPGRWLQTQSDQRMTKEPRCTTS